MCLVAASPAFRGLRDCRMHLKYHHSRIDVRRSGGVDDRTRMPTTRQPRSLPRKWFRPRFLCSGKRWSARRSRQNFYFRMWLPSQGVEDIMQVAVGPTRSVFIDNDSVAIAVLH